jgi:hypothetical protein
MKVYPRKRVLLGHYTVSFRAFLKCSVHFRGPTVYTEKLIRID